MSERSRPDSPELSFLRQRCGHLVAEKPDQPGWFRALPGIRCRWGDYDLDTASREVLISLVDPDQQNLPFHRSAEFTAVPFAWRFQFLWRNPDVLRHLVAAINAVHRLAKRPLPETFEPSDFHVGQVLNADTGLQDQYGIAMRWLDDDAKVLDPPAFLTPISYPPQWTGGRTERQCRSFRQAFARRRQNLRLTAPRSKPDGYYRQLLSVWDRREGWTGQPGTKPYDPEQARSLQTACAENGAAPDHYYRAFRLIVGQDYSAIAWEVHFGAVWRDRFGWEHFKRRFSGRKMDAQSRQLEHFFRLLQSGVYWSEAVQLCGAGPELTEQLISLQSHPNVPDLLADLLCKS